MGNRRAYHKDVYIFGVYICVHSHGDTVSIARHICGHMVYVDIHVYTIWLTLHGRQFFCTRAGRVVTTYNNNAQTIVIRGTGARKSVLSARSLLLLKAPCLKCGDICKETCGGCRQGRLHKSCKEKCIYAWELLSGSGWHLNGHMCLHGSRDSHRRGHPP